MLQWNCQNRCFFPEKSDILPAAQWPWPVGTPADGALGLRRRWTADDFVTSKSPQRRIPVLSGTLERRIVWRIPLESPCGAWIVVLCCVLGCFRCMCVCCNVYEREKQHLHPQQTRKLLSIFLWCHAHNIKYHFLTAGPPNLTWMKTRVAKLSPSTRWAGTGVMCDGCLHIWRIYSRHLGFQYVIYL